VAVLVRQFGDIDIAEEAVQDAFAQAKGKILDARIPNRVPSEADLPGRLRAVLAVVYLVFNEGYPTSAAEQPVREAGPYQIQAAINAVHSDARAAVETDWPQILQLYELMSVAPGPIVALNRAVALAEVKGACPALALVESLDSIATICFTPFAPICYAVLAATTRPLRRTRRRSHLPATPRKAHSCSGGAPPSVDNRRVASRLGGWTCRAGSEPFEANGEHDQAREPHRAQNPLDQTSPLVQRRTVLDGK
jgi:hypothetical protein